MSAISEVVLNAEVQDVQIGDIGVVSNCGKAVIEGITDATGKGKAELAVFTINPKAASSASPVVAVAVVDAGVGQAKANERSQVLNRELVEACYCVATHGERASFNGGGAYNGACRERARRFCVGKGHGQVRFKRQHRVDAGCFKTSNACQGHCVVG